MSAATTMELIRFCAMLSLGLTGLCLVMLPLLDRPGDREEPSAPPPQPRVWSAEPRVWSAEPWVGAAEPRVGAAEPREPDERWRTIWAPFKDS